MLVRPERLVFGNLKSNPATLQEFKRYVDILAKELRVIKFTKTELVLCPPIIFLEFISRRNLKKINLGVQDIFWERNGSYTGGVSAAMAKSVGAKYVIVGHNERRRIFGDTANTINMKLKSVFKESMKAVLCIGETIEERESGQIKQVLHQQISESLQGIGPGRLDSLVIAYEPVWAIGTDVVPTSNEIMQVKLLIKKILSEIYGERPMQRVIIIYGGSVNAQIVNSTCIDSEMEGVLVGRESLIPHELVKIASIIDKN